MYIYAGYIVNRKQCHNITMKFVCGGDEPSLNQHGCSISDNKNCLIALDMCFSVKCSSCQATPGTVSSTDS